MALDFNKIKQQKQALEASFSRGKVSARFWQPKNGKNDVRILPQWAKDGDFVGQFWREVSQHWNINEDKKGPVLCPSKTPYLVGACPVCEFIEQLKADESNPAAKQLASEIRAKKAFLLSIVDLKDPVYTAGDVADFKKASPDRDPSFEVGSPKIQVYACPPSVMDQILGIVSANNLDITDRDSGHNVFITKHGNAKNPMLTRYEVSPDLKPKPAPINADTELPQLDQVGKVMEYKEIMNLLAEGVGGNFGMLPATTTSHYGGGSDAEMPDVDQEELSVSTGPVEAPSAAVSDLEKQMQAALKKGKK